MKGTCGRLASIASLAISLGVSAVSSDGQVTGVRATKHNLSAGSGNPVRATSENQVCVFCHTPHSSRTDAPLWNRTNPATNYVPYTSPSLQALAQQPNGYSKLCLSCHDGSIAVGSVLNPPNPAASTTISMTGTSPDGSMPAGGTRLGTNLANDHPVSFVYDAVTAADDGELVSPLSLPPDIALYEGSTPGVRNSLQCVSCHDPHTDQRPKFLRRDARGRTSGICLVCHAKPGWAASSHEQSSKVATIDGISLAVSEHSCLGCHAPHTTDGAERLLRNAALGGVSALEQVCYGCHAATGPAKNLQAEFAKNGRHPVEAAGFAGNHRPMFQAYPAAGLPENVLLRPGAPAPDTRFTDARHVECVDCHNPHRVTANNKLDGMRGIGLSGAVLEAVRNDSSAAGPSEQYAICLRCHGDSYLTALPSPLASGLSPTNKRTEFQISNSSFHPVGGTGRNLSGALNAQLTPNGLSTNATIRCTDCHNSNAYGTTNGRVTPVPSAASGPHGSTNASILRANYRSQLNVSTYNRNNFAVCFLCHSETALFGTSTNFWDNINGKDNLHSLHVRDRVDKTGAICKSCHFNIHSNAEATNTQYSVNGSVTSVPPAAMTTRLINFHPNVRPIGGRARPEWWIDTSTRERRCYLQCHTVGGATGGEIMNGESGSGGKRAQYRPTATGDVP